MISFRPEKKSPTPEPQELPDVLPLFTLPNILLLPRGRLPLNIFEPRYMAMIDEALGHGRMVGIVQQREAEARDGTPALYNVGCMGRIVTFSESENGHYLISLQGVSRFALGEELPQQAGYRRVRPDWSSYADDVNEPPPGPGIERAQLITALRQYFKIQGIVANWDVLQDTSDENLITSLAMTCPFASWEHQALLEAPNLAERARLLRTLIEMAMLEQPDQDVVRH